MPCPLSEAAPFLKAFLKFQIQVVWASVVAFCRLFAPSKPKSVKGEIVLITGAGHGMGKELALLYASKGAVVVAWDINKNSVEETVAEISEHGYPRAYAYSCDVSNRENVFEVAKKVQEEVGDVTILINNAGIMPTHSLLEHTKEEIERIFAVNVFAHFWTIQTFLPTMMKNNRGHIVAMSSSAGLVGCANLVPYCGSKFAVLGLMESLFWELRSNPCSQIKITTVCPYMVDTGLCKNPKIRFENLMPLLRPSYVAKRIMAAQRRDWFLVTVPGYLQLLFQITRLMPFKAGVCVAEFLDINLESDL